MTDVDGITYVDLLGNYTAGLLGHSPEAVRTAIVEQLDRGWAIGATHPLEIELAELVCDAVPVDRAGAVHELGHRGEPDGDRHGDPPHRATRVVVFAEGYHGGVLSFAHGVGALNVPFDFTVLPYNDVARLERLFDVRRRRRSPASSSNRCRVPAAASSPRRTSSPRCAR